MHSVMYYFSRLTKLSHGHFVLMAALALAASQACRSKNSSQLAADAGVPFTATSQFVGGQLQLNFTPPSQFNGRIFKLSSVTIRGSRGAGSVAQTLDMPRITDVTFVSDASGTAPRISCQANNASGGQVGTQISGTCSGVDSQLYQQFRTACTNKKGRLVPLTAGGSDADSKTCECKVPTDRTESLAFADYLTPNVQNPISFNQTLFDTHCTQGKTVDCNKEPDAAQKSALDRDFEIQCKAHAGAQFDTNKRECICPVTNMNLAQNATRNCNQTRGFFIDVEKFPKDSFGAKCLYTAPTRTPTVTPTGSITPTRTPTPTPTGSVTPTPTRTPLGGSGSGSGGSTPSADDIASVVVTMQPDGSAVVKVVLKDGTALNRVNWNSAESNMEGALTNTAIGIEGSQLRLVYAPKVSVSFMLYEHTENSVSCKMTFSNLGSGTQTMYVRTEREGGLPKCVVH